MGYKAVKYVPFKISRCLFVPQSDNETLQIVLTSKMEKEENKLVLFNITPDTIDQQSILKTNTKIADIGWVRSFIYKGFQYCLT
jgi:hypothetical protein